jgi:DNA-binding MarR family transcriptional regulator
MACDLLVREGDEARSKGVAVETHHIVEQPQWSEEQLRYRVLEYVYTRAGASCTRSVSGEEIGAGLQIHYEDLFRVVHALERHGYLCRIDRALRVCITPAGNRYIEEHAGRRRSVRLPAA